MTDSSRIAREYIRLTINMNVSPVDENLYVRSLRNRAIPYDIRLCTFDNQNTKIKKYDSPPRCSSLTTSHKLTTADLSAQLPHNRNKCLTLDQTFRQRSPQHPLQDQNKLIPQMTR